MNRSIRLQKSRWLLTVAVPLAIACLMADARAEIATDAAITQTAGVLPARDTGEVDEIVVTAEKRSQKINEVPMSIQAFTGDKLKDAGVSDVSGIAQLTPGLNFSRSSQNTPIYTMRGVGFNTPNLSSTSPVGIYVDEIAYAYPYMSSGPLFDIERVEVLKGPQGTLYGRNTTGGLINFNTAQPADRFETGVTAELGNYATHNFEGYVSGPVTDTLGIRVAGRIENSDDGWQHSISRGDTLGRKDNGAARITAVWKPIDRLSINLMASYWYDKSDTVAPQAVLYSPQQPAFAIPGLKSAVRTDWQNDQADWATGNGQPPLATNSEFYSVASRIAYQVTDNLSVMSLTGYNHVDRNDYNDESGTQYDVFGINGIGRISSFSQEFRAVGDLDSLKYIVGLYYSHDGFTDDQVGYYDGTSTNHLLRFLAQNLIDPTNQRYSAAQYADGFANYRNIMNGTSDSKSVFANADYQLFDQLKLTGGIRITDDSLKYGSCSADYNGNTLPIWNTSVDFLVGSATHGTPNDIVAPNQCMTFNAAFTEAAPFAKPSLDEKNIGGRVGIEYTPITDLLTYGTISRGFKSGAAPVLAGNVSTQLDPVGQEEVMAYEAGVKAALFDHRVQVTAAVFYDNYKNKQLFSDVLDPVFTVLTRLVNIPKSEVEGGELEVDWKIIPGLLAHAGTAYTRSKVESFAGYDRFGVAQNFAGSSFPYTPKWQTNVSLTYAVPVFDDYTLEMTANANHNSKTSGSLGAEDGFGVKAYTLVNLNARISSPDGRWSVGLYGRNVFNEYYWTSVDVLTDTVFRTPGMPATYGATLTYRY